MFGRTLSEDDDVEEGNGKSSPEVEYTFEGFNIEFSEKVVLTPPGSAQREPAKG